MELLRMEEKLYTMADAEERFLFNLDNIKREIEEKTVGLTEIDSEENCC